LKIVLDTNVLVSALLKPNSVPGRILNLVLAKQAVLVLDHRIFVEYRDVLYRPEFELPREAVADLLDFLWYSSEQVQGGDFAVELPDPEDRMFIEVAVNSLADALVTGNIKHFPTSQRHGVHVVTPRQFLDLWVRQNKSV
jgi:putative PIN family toxin of toxin-antitoxin system